MLNCGSLQASERMTPKRVAILSPIGRNPGRPHGGITPVVLNLTREFAEQGFQVDLLTDGGGIQERSGQLSPGVGIVSLATKHSLGSLLGLIRYLRSSQPDMLLTAGHRYNKIGAWARRLGRARTCVCLSIHNNVSQGLRSQSPLRRWRRWTSMKILYPWADHIVAVSDGVAEDFAENTGIERSRITVIHNPIVTPDIEQRARQPADHPWLQDKKHPVIMGMGRLARQKDFPTLLRAFAAVSQRLDCRLIILGEGPERTALETLAKELGIADEVSLPGFVSNPFAYLARADLFVLSSAWEGFGNVLVEALSVGVRVVATDCESGPREILDNGRFGSLVPVGDADAMAKAMLHQLRHPADHTILHRAAEGFSAVRAATRYLEVFGLRTAATPSGPGSR
jgi:glycosyltransferase involved in cell wall biosynthesis